MPPLPATSVRRQFETVPVAFVAFSRGVGRPMFACPGTRVPQSGHARCDESSPCPAPGVAARFGVAARTHHRDAQRNQPRRRRLRRLARREHKADIGGTSSRNAQTSCARSAVGHVRERLEFARTRTPAAAAEIVKLRLPANSAADNPHAPPPLMGSGTGQVGPVP